MSDCLCSKCRRSCRFTPGWFKPDEADKLTNEQKSQLVVDFYFVPDSESIYVLRPRTLKEKGGEMSAFDPTGVCVFFKDDRCSIHSVKPYQCAESLTCKHIGPSKLDISKLWDTAEGKKEIKKFLGKKPEIGLPTFSDTISLALNILNGEQI